MKLIYFLFLSLLLQSCIVQKHAAGEMYLFAYFKNNGQDGLHLASSTDGYNWASLNLDSSFLKPAVGNDKLMRDPCVIRGADGKFHMVWTVSWQERGIGYASSSDLLNWSQQKYIPVMEHEPLAKNCWAPELFYDKEKKQYIIFWATTIPGRFPETENAGDNNHRIYYVTTKDFSTFSETKLLYNQGFNVIDATIQKNGDQYVMFLKDETRNPPEKNVRVAFSSEAAGNYSKPSQPITGDYWAEGPTAIKIGDEWLVYFDKYTKHEYGAVKSKDLKNWTDISDQVHFPKGTRHGTIISITKKEYERLLSKPK